VLSDIVFLQFGGLKVKMKCFAVCDSFGTMDMHCGMSNLPPLLLAGRVGWRFFVHPDT
jgi:hypothetical protein